MQRKSSQRSPRNTRILPVRGFLMHVTHYDGRWLKRKRRETPFDPDVALEALDVMAQEKMNTLLLDLYDGVVYRSHPELARHYSVPAKTLRVVLRRARELGLQLIPKLNFAQTDQQRHHWWLKPHEEKFLKDECLDEAFSIAFDLIDEVCAECRPERFFHIGMDEDLLRSYSQYVDTILRLRNGLKQRGLRTVIWNDSPHKSNELIHGEKSMYAEQRLPKDVVHVLWDYRNAYPQDVKRIAREGFELWIAPGPNTVRDWKSALVKHAKPGRLGMYATFWNPTTKHHRKRLLDRIRVMGPIFAEPY